MNGSEGRAAETIGDELAKHIPKPQLDSGQGASANPRGKEAQGHLLGVHPSRVTKPGSVVSRPPCPASGRRALGWAEREPASPKLC